MEISQLILAQLLLYAFFIGAGLGAVYDVFSITRIFLGVPFSSELQSFLQKKKIPFLKKTFFRKHNVLLGVICFLEDFLLALGASGCLILLFYECNHGKIRIPAMVCFFLGTWCYRTTVGRFLRPMLEFLFLILLNAIRSVFYFAFLPARAAFSFLHRMVICLYHKYKKYVFEKQRKHFTDTEFQKLEKNACGML